VFAHVLSDDSVKNLPLWQTRVSQDYISQFENCEKNKQTRPVEDARCWFVTDNS
jgi:hypothetical protein